MWSHTAGSLSLIPYKQSSQVLSKWSSHGGDFHAHGGGEGLVVVSRLRRRSHMLHRSCSGELWVFFPPSNICDLADIHTTQSKSNLGRGDVLVILVWSLTVAAVSMQTPLTRSQLSVCFLRISALPKGSVSVFYHQITKRHENLSGWDATPNLSCEVRVFSQTASLRVVSALPSSRTSFLISAFSPM